MKHLFPLIATAALLAGCAKENTFQPPPPPQVGVSAPLVKDVILYDVFPGRVSARDSVRIMARVPGNLENIHFTDGQTVKRGDVLFTVEQPPYQAAVDAAAAALAQAKAARSLADAALSRKKKAFESQAVSELDVLSAEADLEAAAAQVQASEANLEKARLDFSYTTISAPMDGVMSDSAVSTGNLVGPGGTTELALLVRVDPANVVFSVDERRLLPKLRDPEARVKPPKVKLSLADGDEYPVEGEIDYLDNVVDQRTGTLRARAVFPNPDRVLFDGMFARVKIPRPVADSMLVPETAILKDLVGSFVYTLDAESTVQATYIETGDLVDGMRIVTGGLEKDARVVVKGIQRVRPGVKAATGDGPGGAPAAGQGE